MAQDNEEEEMSDVEEVIGKETLEAALTELHSIGGNHVEKLAKAVCILLSGLIIRVLEEYEPTEEDR